MKELIAELRELADPAKAKQRHWIADAARRAADALERFQWVSVQERLPEVCSLGEYGHWVLVYNGHHRGVGALRDFEDGEPPKWLDEHNEWIEPPPTRWMEIPAEPAE